ncbi:unnamed protein product [Rhodiola kirilowii]
MGRDFEYVIIGGGVAAGYAALEFVNRGVSRGQLCIISDELVVPYERPALSKGVLRLEAPALVSSFQTCVASNEERLTPEWYKEHVARLFTPKIARFYEDYYKARGVDIIKRTIISSFEMGSDSQKVVAVNLRDGRRVPADMVVIAIGIRPNTSLFDGQLTMEKGGIKVNGYMQSSNSYVYAVGDAAAFPIKPFGKVCRLEHADSARKSARHAVAAIMDPKNTCEFNYLPLFYSRAFQFCWQFYGQREGEAVHFGEYSLGSTFGAYWVANGHLVGSFLEAGTKQQYQAIASATSLGPKVHDLDELERQGLDFAISVSQPPKSISSTKRSQTPLPDNDIIQEIPLYNWNAATGVLVAASVAGFAYWYGRKRRRW